MDEAQEKNDISQTSDLDYQFHLEISKATQNSIFVLVYELIGKLFHRHTQMMTELYEEIPAENRGDGKVHWRLYQAIQDKDIEKCRICYMEMLYNKQPE